MNRFSFLVSLILLCARFGSCNPVPESVEDGSNLSNAVSEISDQVDCFDVNTMCQSDYITVCQQEILSKVIESGYSTNDAKLVLEFFAHLPHVIGGCSQRTKRSLNDNSYQKAVEETNDYDQISHLLDPSSCDKFLDQLSVLKGLLNIDDATARLLPSVKCSPWSPETIDDNTNQL